MGRPVLNEWHPQEKLEVGKNICHTIIARTFFCLENYLDSKARNATHKITLVLHTNFFEEFYLKCVILLGNKAHEASVTHSWVTRLNFQGELISVKMGCKHPIITH